MVNVKNVLGYTEFTLPLNSQPFSSLCASSSSSSAEQAWESGGRVSLTRHGTPS